MTLWHNEELHWKNKHEKFYNSGYFIMLNIAATDTHPYTYNM